MTTSTTIRQCFPFDTNANAYHSNGSMWIKPNVRMDAWMNLLLLCLFARIFILFFSFWVRLDERLSCSETNNNNDNAHEINAQIYAWKIDRFFVPSTSSSMVALVGNRCRRCLSPFGCAPIRLLVQIWAGKMSKLCTQGHNRVIQVARKRRWHIRLRELNLTMEWLQKKNTDMIHSTSRKIWWAGSVRV